MIDPRAALVIVALWGAYLGVHRVARLFHHRVDTPHCREFKATRPADEIAITGHAHYCQFDEVDGSFGFAPEACGCK